MTKIILSGVEIRAMRKALKLTQKQFGERLSITHSYLSDVERGKKTPSETLVSLINKIYAELKTGQGEAKTTTSDQQSILYPYSLDNKSIHDRVEKVLTVADQSLKEAFIKGLEGVILSMESEKHTNLLNTILLRMDSQDAAINELRLLNASPKKDIAASGS